MQVNGINWGYLLSVVLPIAVWLVCAIVALAQLRHRSVSDTARAVWTALILLVPLAGALAFWLVQPGRRSPGQGESV
jgi:uncharacterized membrane protein YhaH (DUF805 family)